MSNEATGVPGRGVAKCACGEGERVVFCSIIRLALSAGYYQMCKKETAMYTCLFIF